MPFKYIGRTTDFKGKSLWEILGNLKNFGVGRIIARSRFERYPEPSYIKILKVETLPEPAVKSLDDIRKVKVWVERTFRGRKTSKDIDFIQTSSYKSDYKLIPKDEEESYCKLRQNVDNVRILPRTMPFPPLMRELILREMKAKGQPVTKELELNVSYNLGSNKMYRVAEENERPNVTVDYGHSLSKAHRLYKGIKL